MIDAAVARCSRSVRATGIRMTSESQLREKLRKIEALFVGAGTAGERLAAEAALRRVRARVEELARHDPPIEQQFSLPDQWSRHLFLALCRRYGLRPFRYRRQRRNTVMVRASRGFVSSPAAGVHRAGGCAASVSARGDAARDPRRDLRRRQRCAGSSRRLAVELIKRRALPPNRRARLSNSTAATCSAD
jgi:hypothetical protein